MIGGLDRHHHRDLIPEQVWQAIQPLLPHHRLLDGLCREPADWSRASLDSLSARAKRGAV